MAAVTFSSRRRTLLKGAALGAGMLAAPLVARAQPTTTIINPNGQSYLCYPGDSGPIGSMVAHPGNPVIRSCNVPLPAGIAANHSRLTFAVDVCTVDSYYSTPGAHIVVASRVNMQDPLDFNGGSAWQGTIAGELWGNGRVLAEERRSTGNLHPWGTGANSVTSHTWYRFVVDTVKWMGYRMYDCRVYAVADELNNVLGSFLYSSGSMYYPDSGYADTNDVMFVNVSQSTSSLIVGRVAAHWTPADEWVATP